MVMDERQNYAYDTVRNGHNLVITGQAGTGKSFMIRKIYDELSTNKNIAITASTGIAATLYSYATTLHKWAGIGDGRYTNLEIFNLVNTDERFVKTKKRILDTELLIIDEISMISKRILNQVEFLCRKIRVNENPFGSLQVVLSGDFFQLPPVKDYLYGDHGHYCFENDWFEKCFPHRVNLTTVYRQSETKLANAVNELERGSPSTDTEKFMSGLKRPLEDPSNVVKLFARNMEVDMYNASKLEDNPNKLHLYKSDDEGDSTYLKSMQAPRYLALKKDAPVMLLVNLSDELVNGSIGKVTDFGKDDIFLKFTINTKEVNVTVKKHLFSKYDPISKKNIATRSQFPIRLAYGITIHKSQGMTLKAVEIDCQHIFNPGQLGVAVGRAVCTSGLRVVNFHSCLSKKHPSKVYTFYDAHRQSENETNTDEYLRCCRFQVRVHFFEEGQDVEPVPEVFDTDYDSDFLNEIDEHAALLTDLDETEADQSFLTSDHNYVVAEIKECNPLLERTIHDFIDTPRESEARQTLTKISRNSTKITEFLKRNDSKIRAIYDSCVPQEKPQQKHVTAFYTEFNTYLSSVEYTRSVEMVTGCDEMGRQLLTTLMFLMQGEVLKEKAAAVEKSPSILNIQPSVTSEISSAGRGKTRYIGGYAIAKIKYRISKSIHNCLFVPGLELELKKLKTQLNIADLMSVSAADISSTSQHQETLQETARKQYISGGLTNISDDAFEFFEYLELQIRKKLSYKNLVQQKKYLFRNVRESLYEDTSVLKKFCSVYNSCRRGCVDGADPDHEKEVSSVLDLLVEEVDSLDKVLKMIINLFLVVSVSQFRKDYLTAIRREKGKALRKKVMEKANTKTKDVDMGFIQNDKSEHKLISHLKLKACALQNENFYKQFTKKQLSQLVEAYGSKISTSKSNKCALGQELVSKLQERSDMPFPNIVDASGEVVSLPGKDKGPDIPGTGLDISDISTALDLPMDIPGPSTDIPGPSTDIPGPSTDIHDSSDIPGPSSGYVSAEEKTRTKGQKRKSKSKTSKGKGKGKGKRTLPNIVDASEEVVSLPEKDKGPDIPGTGLDISDISTALDLPMDIPGPSTDIPGPSTDIPGPSTDIPGPSTDIHGSSDIPGPSSEYVSAEEKTRTKGQKRKSKSKTSKGKRKGKGKRTRRFTDDEIIEDSSENCGICSKSYKDSEDWICCDICTLWYHRDCAGLEDDEDWEQCSSSLYTCPLCL